MNAVELSIYNHPLMLSKWNWWQLKLHPFTEALNNYVFLALTCGWELERAQSASASVFPSPPHLKMHRWVCVFGTRWFLKLKGDINSLEERKVIGFLFCRQIDV